MQLRSRGFKVETVLPDSISQTPADLEVRLEGGAIDTVLAQVSEMAGADVVCVYVAPGALDDRARVPLPDVPADLSLAEPPIADEGEAEPAELPAATLAATESETAEIELPAAVPAAMLPTEPLEIAIPNLFSESTDSAEAEVTPEAALVTATGDASSLIAATSSVSNVPEEAAPAQELPEVAHGGQASPAPVADREPFAQPVPAALPRVEPRAPRVARGRSRAEADRAFWRVAVAAAGVAALVVLAGTLWHRVRPMPANLLEPGSKQQTPFQKVEKVAPASPAPAVHGPVNASASAVAPAAKNPAIPGAEVPAPAPPAAQVAVSGSASQVVVHSSAVEHVAVKKSRTPKPVRSNGGGLIAEDTVVFYDRKPGAAPAKQAPQPGVKQYSDVQ
jgi:hypothetical protein